MKLAPLFKFAAKERTGAGCGGDWLAVLAYSREAVNCFYISLLLSLSYRVHREIVVIQKSRLFLSNALKAGNCVFSE